MGYKFIKPLRITYNPQPGITASELARLLPILFRLGHTPMMPIDLSGYSEDVLRHLIIVDPNKEGIEDGMV